MATDFSTDVILCTGVPISADYEHTLYFEDETERRRYFQDKTKFLLHEYSYQRSSRNSIKIEKKKDELDQINYMIFKNVNHTNRWYYCFVMAINYINENTSEIIYDIDVIQTWLGDCELGESMVIRNHTETDQIGENIVEENVDIGDEYIASSIDYIDTPLNCAVVSFDFSNTPIDFGRTFFDYLYPIPYYIRSFKYINEFVDTSSGGRVPSERSQYQSFSDFFSSPTGWGRQNPDKLYSAYLVPIECTVTDDDITNANPINVNDNIKSFSLPYDIDGYTPKNNKLFTYPYCSLQIDNGEGNIATYRYEDFKKEQGISDHSQRCKFSLVGFATVMPELNLIPKDYMGIPLNTSQQISMRNFPEIAYSIGSMERYLEYNRNSFVTSLLNSTISSAMDLGTTIAPWGGVDFGSIAFNQAGASLSALSQGDYKIASYKGAVRNEAVGVTSTAIDYFGKVTSEISRISDLRDAPKQLKNQTSLSLSSMQTNTKRFTITFSTIKKEFAVIVDNFFTRYGYSIKKIMKPSIHNRSEYTFIKTAGLTLVGNISQSVELKIKQIFDNGITFWVNPSHVGKYFEYDNIPIGNTPEPVPPVPAEFVARLEINSTELGNMRTLPFYNNERYNAYVRYNIPLPACTSYAYGRSVEIANNLGKQALIMRTDGVSGSYDWKAGRGDYASPNTTGSHYAYPSGENCVDACSLGNWNVSSEPQVGDIVSWYYENGDDDGHVAVVEQILHYDSNGRADRIMTSNSASHGLYFYTAEIRRDEYSKEPHTNWLPIPEGKGKWYNGDGTVNKIWCGGFAHNPAFYVD